MIGRAEDGTTRKNLGHWSESLKGWPAAQLALWLATLIFIPHAHALGGDGLLYAAISLSVILQVGAVLAILSRCWGWRYTWAVTCIVLPVAWGVEFLGSTTGIPFGPYHYTQVLQPQLGHVPLLIPLAWLMMLPPAWAVAQRIARRSRGPIFVLCSAAAFTAWDLFLDPQMVQWRLWVWEKPGGYFGIPWANYAGWLLGSALITLLVRPRHLPELPLLVVYGLTWLMETIGLLFFWQLPGPALAGLLGMGVFLGLAWIVPGGVLWPGPSLVRLWQQLLGRALRLASSSRTWLVRVLRERS